MVSQVGQYQTLQPQTRPSVAQPEGVASARGGALYRSLMGGMGNMGNMGSGQSGMPRAVEASPQFNQSNPLGTSVTIQSTPDVMQAKLSTPVKAKKVTLPVVQNAVPTVAGVEHLDAEVVQELIHMRKCVLVDVRGEDRASGLIDGAQFEPAIDTVPFTTKVPDLVNRWRSETLVIFTCQYSAHRAPQCANWYRAKADPQQRVGILTGGFRGWEAQGLPVKALATNIADAQAADQFAREQGAQFVRAVQPQVTSYN